MLLTYVLGGLDGDETVSKEFEKELHLELQKAYQKEFRIEQLIKKKGGKLHVTWKAYDNSLSSWINNKKYHYISYIVIAEAKFEIKKKQQVLMHQNLLKRLIYLV